MILQNLFNIAVTHLNMMLCPSYESIGDGICDEVNYKYICLYDGGDCKDIHNYSSLEQIENQYFDPCPEYESIGNGQCNGENYNFICSFDGGDCQLE